VKYLLTVGSVVLFLLAIHVESAEAETSLFNGKDLSGWVPMNGAVFTVTNGVIHLAKSTGWLRTEKQYTNFIFEAEWRALETNYNSGFFLRAGLEGKPFPTEVWQVNLKETALGSLMKGSKTVVPFPTTPGLRTPPLEWVAFRMEARGKTLTLEISGKRAWQFEQLEPGSGYIGLQAEGRMFDFRNLRIQELP
jgi:hypothetical protein